MIFYIISISIVLFIFFVIFYYLIINIFNTIIILKYRNEINSTLDEILNLAWDIIFNSYIIEYSTSMRIIYEKDKIKLSKEFVDIVFNLIPDFYYNLLLKIFRNEEKIILHIMHFFNIKIAKENIMIRERQINITKRMTNG